MSRLVGALAVCALALGGCRSSQAGDPVPPPVANELGDGTPISSKLDGSCNFGMCTGRGLTCNSDADCPGFFGPQSWVQMSNPNSLNCPYPPEYYEYVTGVTITAVDTWDEDGNGSVGSVYVQDTIGLDDATKIPVYAGTSIFEPSYSPPTYQPQAGDVIDISGDYEEFAGPSTDPFQYCETLPQMSGSASFRFDGTVPPPVEITADDLASFDSARSYMSMLVKVNNVAFTAAGKESSGRYSAPVGVSNGINWDIDDELWDVPGKCPIDANLTFKSVTGIVTFFYGYHLAPRSGYDFDPPCGIPADAGTGG